jgi:hypothetical protein
MLLFAAEWADGAVRLFTARNATEAVERAAANRDNERPSHIWILVGAHRRPVQPTD